jgi:hypothetical protein
MTTATTFTIISECFRCHGFKRAFSTFNVNSGRCFRCNGGLRTIVTKPIERLAEVKGDASQRRAESIATIAKVLSIVGAPAPRDLDGKCVSEWGFAHRVKSDTIMIFASALTIAPADVRRRGWAAFCAKARATLADRSERVIEDAKRAAAAYAGLTEQMVDAWLGNAMREAA